MEANRPLFLLHARGAKQIAEQIAERPLSYFYRITTGWPGFEGQNFLWEGLGDFVPKITKAFFQAFKSVEYGQFLHQ